MELREAIDLLFNDIDGDPESQLHDLESRLSESDRDLESRLSESDRDLESLLSESDRDLESLPGEDQRNTSSLDQYHKDYGQAKTFSANSSGNFLLFHFSCLIAFIGLLLVQKMFCKLFLMPWIPQW